MRNHLGELLPGEEFALHQPSAVMGPFGYDDALYVSNFGRVRHYATGYNWTELTPQLNKRGYYEVWWRGRTWPVHRLMAEAFDIPNPDGYRYILFKDGDKSNCQLDNLVWSYWQRGISRRYY